MGSGTVDKRFEPRPQPGARSGTEGLPELFKAAFTQSKNAMVLVDLRRRIVDANGAQVRLLGFPRHAIIGSPVARFLVGGSVLSPAEWRAALAAGRSAGKAEVVSADGGHTAVQWAATSEVVTGQRLTLVVVLSTSRWGGRFRRTIPARSTREAVPARERGLSARERQIVRLVALGDTGPEIADELQISHATVRTHVRNAMEKTDARSRAHLVAKALGYGMVLD